jgi:hypothetical protein
MYFEAINNVRAAPYNTSWQIGHFGRESEECRCTNSLALAKVLKVEIGVNNPIRATRG